MSEFLSCLISVSSLVGVSAFLSYGEREDKILKIASSLILAYVTVLPVVTLIRDFDYDASVDLGDGSFMYIEDTLIGEEAENAFCKGIEKYISERFSLSSEEITVRVFGFEYTSMKAEKIKVILSGKAVFADNRAIAEEIEKNGLGECEVELSVK